MKIINILQIEATIDELVKDFPLHAQEWARKAVRAHIIKNVEPKRVIDAKELQNGFTKILCNILEANKISIRDSFHFIDADQYSQPWIQIALRNGEPLGFISFPEGVKNVLHYAAHIEPSRLKGMTYNHVVKQIHENERERKVKAEMAVVQHYMRKAKEDVTVVFENETHLIARLNNLSAVRGEGHWMNNCLRYPETAAKYFYGTVAIDEFDFSGMYSLRKKGEDRPKATVMIGSDQRIISIKGYNNSSNIDDDAMLALEIWKAEIAPICWFCVISACFVSVCILTIIIMTVMRLVA